MIRAFFSRDSSLIAALFCEDFLLCVWCSCYMLVSILSDIVMSDLPSVVRGYSIFVISYR